MTTKSKLPDLVKKYEDEILQNWVKEQLSAITLRKDLISESDLREQSKDFLNTFQKVCQSGELTEISGAQWDNVKTFLKNLSKSRAKLGFTPSETATFIFSLKQPIFALLQRQFGNDANTFASEILAITVLIDKLGLFTTDVFIKGKEEIIKRQMDEMLELSTPVVKLWNHILAIPLIGTLDSARTQVVMENLLQEIVNTSSSIAIIDITGVPTVDTLVAQHLMKTVSAARLMGSECIVSGIRPQIAQTMVHLGVSFSDIVTKATLADVIRYAFEKTGVRISQASARE